MPALEDSRSSRGQSFEDTATVLARGAPRTARARLVDALNRITEPHVLFPVGALAILGILWSTTLHLVDTEFLNARSAAIVSTRELLGTYEAQVVRAIGEIDQTAKLVQYIADSKPNPKVLSELQDHGLLPPNLLFDVSLVDALGVVVASNRAIHPANVQDSTYFVGLRDRSGEDQELWVDRPRRDAESKQWRIQFSRRLSSKDGAFAGVVTVGIDADYFVSGYERSKLGQHGVLGVLGSDGIFRVRRTGDEINAGDTVDYASVVAPSSGEEDAAVALTKNPWDGVRRYSSGRQLYNLPVAVIVGLSEDEQLAVAVAARRTYLQRASIGSAFVILLSGILGRLSWQLLQSRSRESAAKAAYGQRVEYLAYHDGLTGLPNRSLFSRLLARAIRFARRHERRLVILFLDLDRFKQINDTLGHEAGDELLQGVGQRLQSCLRESDTVARLGGDEFVVLLPELESTKYAEVVAEKMLATLMQPFSLMGQQIGITASIGICTYPEDGEDEQVLTKHADTAMYQAKAAGRNKFRFYSATVNNNSLDRLSMESSLRHALEHQEFLLNYQAKWDLASGRITGVEALLRWQHPHLGSIAPLQFLSVADDTGLIVPIGKWVLKTACLQNVAWQKLGHPDLNIAVNLTTRQFLDENLLQDIAAILRETGMQPQLLEFEITEGSLIRDMDKTLRIMTGLKAMGIKIAVDNFGADYASLLSLRKYPLDTIKIDLPFLRDLSARTPVDPKSEQGNLADTIIAMGRSLSLTVVAQGVETQEQADYLRVHACDEVQGFYYNKPMPSEQITELLQNPKELARVA